jgi:hypothetical protein
MENIFFEGNAEDFRERMIWAINEFCGPANYKFLEKKFGIGARKWQNMCNRAQQPSVEMLAAIATVRPYFVFWLLTGKELDVPQLNPQNKNWNDHLWQQR